MGLAWGLLGACYVIVLFQGRLNIFFIMWDKLLQTDLHCTAMLLLIQGHPNDGIHLEMNAFLPDGYFNRKKTLLETNVFLQNSKNKSFF